MRRGLLLTVLWINGACAEPAEGVPVPAPVDLAAMDPELTESIEAASGIVTRSGSRADWVELAMIYDANGLDALALETYRRVPGPDARIHYHLGRVLAELGRAEEALEEFDLALRDVPDYAPLHWRRGELLAGRGDLDTAAEAYARSLDLAPGDAAGTIGLARIHLQRDAPEAAVRVLEPLVERDPRTPLANGLLARAYRQLGRRQRADRALRREERAGEPRLIDPWTAEVLRREVGLRVSLERAQAAIVAGDAASALLELRPFTGEGEIPVAIASNLARALLLEGDWAGALRVLERVPPADAQHYRVLLERGRALDVRGDLEGAHEALSAVVRANPAFGEGWSLLGEVELKLDRAPDAAESLRRALAEGRDAVRDRLLSTRAELEIGDTGRAREVLEEGLEDYPNSAALWAALADVHLAAGRLEDALTAFGRAEDSDPGLPQLQALRTRIDAADPD